VIDMPKDHLRGMTRLEARVGLANLGRYKEILRRRAEAAETYFESLAFGPDLVPPPRIPGATYSHFSIRVPEREGLLQAALKRGVQLGCIPEYSIPEMRAYGGHPPEDFPRAADWARRVVNLPVWGGAPVARRVLKRLKGLLPVRSG